MTPTLVVVGRVAGAPGACPLARARLTVGEVAHDELRGEELTLELDDGAVVRVAVDAARIDAVPDGERRGRWRDLAKDPCAALFSAVAPSGHTAVVLGGWCVQTGGRVAVRAEVLEPGDPHPTRVEAHHLAHAPPGADPRTVDRQLLAALDGDHGAAAQLARRRGRRAPQAGPPPYGRTSAGLAIAGAFLLGAGLARWGSIAEIRQLPPPGWTVPALVLGLWASLSAAALAVGRAPLELAHGHRGTQGRPPWNVMAAVIAAGLGAVLYAGFATVERAGGVALAPHVLGLCGAFGVGLLLHAEIKHRRALGFGHRLFWTAPRFVGRLDGEALEHTVRYVRRSRTYDAQASANVTAPATITLRADGTTQQVTLTDARWSAPTRHARPDAKAAAITVTRIGPGDEVLVVGERPTLVFGAPRAARVALLAAFAAHGARVAWLVALITAAIALAARLA